MMRVRPSLSWQGLVDEPPVRARAKATMCQQVILSWCLLQGLMLQAAGQAE